MRLLNVHTLQMHGFFHDPAPPYAVVSHRWGGHELTYQDFVKGRITDGPGHQKIVRCAEIAAGHGIEWLWIDTVCIDKTSSAELSEAINSMYDFYRSAVHCYAVLPDLTHGLDAEAMRDLLRKSVYFTRGWTLQELVAPQKVLFFDSAFEFFATKHDLAEILHEITGIRKKYLEDPNLLQSACVAEKMSWMASRRTTKMEDIAYCMMGMFGVHMPLLYGEREQAFFRLQLEILRHNDDETLFAWTSKDREQTGMLASWPSDFSASGSFRKIPVPPEYRVPWVWGGKGLELRLLEVSVMGKDKNDPIPPGQQDKQVTLGCWSDLPDEEYDDDNPTRQRMANRVLAINLKRVGNAWQRTESHRTILIPSFQTVPRTSHMPLLLRHYYIPQETPPPKTYFY